ncbi:MAG: DUF4149 domain-containing protein [Candidatus Binataceae bacterium]
MIIALSIYLLSIACWLGGIVFFSFFTAPAIFTQLPIPEAGKVVGVIFPRYYLLGYVAGIIAFALAAYFTVVKSSRLWWSLATIALAAAVAFTVYAGAVVRPQVDAIRSVAEDQNPDPVRKAEFDRLHRLSVYLNGTVLLLNLAAIVGTAGALTPRG